MVFDQLLLEEAGLSSIREFFVSPAAAVSPLTDTPAGAGASPHGFPCGQCRQLACQLPRTTAGPDPQMKEAQLAFQPAQPRLLCLVVPGPPLTQGQGCGLPLMPDSGTSTAVPDCKGEQSCALGRDETHT